MRVAGEGDDEKEGEGQEGGEEMHAYGVVWLVEKVWWLKW